MNAVHHHAVTLLWELIELAACLLTGCMKDLRHACLLRSYNSCVDQCPVSECGFYASRRNDITGSSGPLGYCDVEVSVYEVCFVFESVEPPQSCLLFDKRCRLPPLSPLEV